jgi:PAS domain S-box-containing protein
MEKLPDVMELHSAHKLFGGEMGKLMRETTDALPALISYVDNEGYYRFCNKAYTDWLGQAPNEIYGKHMEEVLGRKAYQSLHHHIETVLSGQPVSFERQVDYKEAGQRYVQVDYIPDISEQGEVKGFFAMITDLTERKRIEAERERMLAEEQRQAEQLRQLNTSMIEINAAKTTEDVLRLTVDKARELIGVQESAIHLISGSNWSRTIASEEPAQQTACSGIRSPLMGGNGECVGVVQLTGKYEGDFTASDEALLTQLAQTASVALERQKLYEQEQAARRQAEEANRAKDEFLAVVTHELRSPLNAMLGYARLFSKRKQFDSDEVRRVMEVIRSNGERQKVLIDDLLDTARIITGKLRLEVGPVDLAALIEQTLDVVRPGAEAKGVALEPKLDQQAGQISGDPERLQQVVWNLLTNAIKFTPEGGLVEIRLERAQTGVRFIVSDTGEGIAADFLPFVFERFTQQDTSRTRRHGGLGLGLALVKHLVELHGGTIEAASAGPGLGATFTVNLPVIAAHGLPVRVEQTYPAFRLSTPPQLEGVRALIVEEEDGARELLTRVLRGQGAEVTSVDSVLEAYVLISAGSERPNVLICDISTSIGEGYNLMQKIREWERESGWELPAIALTAHNSTEDRLQAMTSGYQMHISKPVEPEELTMAIASLTGRLK